MVLELVAEVVAEVGDCSGAGVSFAGCTKRRTMPHWHCIQPDVRNTHTTAVCGSAKRV